MKQFNRSDYLATPTLVGVLGRSFPGQEAELLRRIWHIVVQHHRDRPQLDAKHYMGLAEENDGHVYTVAAAALLLDLLVMIIIGYIIFCRRKARTKT